MVKKVAVLCAAAGFVLGIGMVPAAILKMVPRIQVITPESISYLPSVQCSGVIESEKSYELVSGGLYQVAEVYAQKGDQVQKGEVLAVLENAQNQAVLVREMQEGAGSGDQLAYLAEQYGISETAWNTLPQEEGSKEILEQLLSASQETVQVEAPEAGILIGDSLEKDTVVSQGTVLFQIQSDSYLVKARLSEGDVGRVSIGDQASITGQGLGDAVCQGRVEQISTVAVQTLAGTSYETVVETDIRITESLPQIRAGYNVKINIFTDEKQSILMVPYEAVGQDAQNQEYVYVPTGGTLEKRIITTGRELAEGVEILSGIEKGETVAVLSSTQDIAEEKIYFLEKE